MDSPPRKQTEATEDLRGLLEGLPEEFVTAPAPPGESYGVPPHVEVPDVDTAGAHRSLPTMEVQFGSSDDQFPTVREGVVPVVSGGAQFALHEQLARGGHGEIWRATQRSLQREIAVKVLIQRGADPHRQLERRRREFIAEAHTAAELEHPNILPVYDLGIDARTGSPMLAMKLIRGENWEQELFDDRDMPMEEKLAKHLPIYLAVCNAVAYAHSHDIIHRDLKPSQVIVGAFGEVLLTDWGLAMRLSSAGGDSPWHVAGKLVPTAQTASNPAGTPSYMAPEQVRRTTEALGKWTDIYLLGGILYRILTDTLPHQGETRTAVLYRAAGGQVQPAAARAPGRPIPPQLAAIAERALSPDPMDRHGSVLELRMEVSDFLTGAARRRESVRLLSTARGIVGEPAAAPEEGILRAFDPLERAIREWPDNEEARALLGACRERLRAIRARRTHWRIGLSAGAAAAVLGFALLFSWQSRRLLAQTEVERDRALRAADTMMTELADGLQPLAGAQSRAVLGIVDKAAATYDEIIAAAGDRPELLERRAQADLRLADLYMTLGNSASAMRHQEQAEQIARRLLDAEPTSNELRELLARALQQRTIVLSAQSAGADTEGGLAEALKLVDAVEASEGESARTLLLRASLLSRLSEAYFNSRRGKEGREAENETIRLLQRGEEKYPDSAEIRLMAIQAQSNAAVTAMYSGRGGDALELSRRCAEGSAALVALDPGNAVWRGIRATRLSQYGQMLAASGKLEDALPIQEEAISYLRELAALDAENTEQGLRLAQVLSERGATLVQMERFAEAREGLLESVAAFEKLSQGDPLNAQFLSGLQLATNWLADTEEALGNLDAAEAHVRRLRVFADRLAELRPGAIQWTFRRADGDLRVARFLRRTGRGTPEEIRSLLLSAKGHMGEVLKSGRVTPEQQKIVDMVEKELAGEATDDVH